MLVVTLVLAWYFYDTVKWYQHDVRQIALGNQILQNYQTLTNQTWGLLNAMGEGVTAGKGANPRRWGVAAESLRRTSEAIRGDIEAEAALRGTDGAADQLKRLADIDQVINRIVGAQNVVAQALEAGDTELAASEFGRLHREGLVALFQQMTESVIADQREVVRRSQGGAIDLSTYIISLLPALMAALIVITFVMAWLFSRSLTRSVNTLYEGAVAFSGGDLSYRIPRLREMEFKRLGEQFNTMARELAEHRASVDDANVKLEAVVEERTRALKTSNEKLAAIDDNRRQLLADISHEFRTPLTVIQGEAEIALRGRSKSVKAYKDSLQRIVEQSGQTTRLVDDLLFIARADGGEPRLDRAEAPVGDLLQAVCKDFAAKAKAKQIEFDRHLPEESPVLFADPGRLRQVFSILLDNAVKYSDEGGQVEVGLTNGGGAITVTVSDRGIGLTEEELKNVFLRYYRSKRAEGHDTGTGLGLPVAKAIVEAHGGEIFLESRSGGGITSTVRLPLEPQEGEPQ